MMRDAEYVAKRGGRCPLCASKNICAIEEIQRDSDRARCHIECHDCGKLWTDEYTLVGYLPDEEADIEKKAQLEEEAIYRCQNCDARWTEDDLLPITNIEERVLPGEIMPSGECPGCGALCHPD
jgi:hypothetical protein